VADPGAIEGLAQHLESRTTDQIAKLTGWSRSRAKDRFARRRAGSSWIRDERFVACSTRIRFGFDLAEVFACVIAG
jgi:hypothetical protein